MGTWYTVQKGDYLNKIALDFGLTDYTAIYNHPDNAAFKKKRPNPNLIYPGDRVFVPDPQTTGIPVPMNVSSILYIETTVLFSLCLCSPDLKPLALYQYELSFPGRTIRRSQVGANAALLERLGKGRIKEHVPIGLSQATLKLWLSETTDPILSYDVYIGGLDPVEELSGVQGRLHNLGFDCHGLSNSLDQASQEALISFQTIAGLEQSGSNDPQTIEKIKQIHRC